MRTSARWIPIPILAALAFYSAAREPAAPRNDSVARAALAHENLARLSFLEGEFRHERDDGGAYELHWIGLDGDLIYGFGYARNELGVNTTSELMSIGVVDDKPVLRRRAFFADLGSLGPGDPVSLVATEIDGSRVRFENENPVSEPAAIEFEIAGDVIRVRESYHASKRPIFTIELTRRP